MSNDLFNVSGKVAVVTGGTGVLGGAMCKALAANGKRADTIVATKFYFPQTSDVNSCGLSRRHLIDACAGDDRPDCPILQDLGGKP